MKPKKMEKKDFERVDTSDFVMGTIEEIQYDQNHEFKFEGKTNIRPAVRIKFKVDGYKYHHYSRYMGFSYGDKANLYLKYLVPLVEGATPDMDFDLDLLKGMKERKIGNRVVEYRVGKRRVASRREFDRLPHVECPRAAGHSRARRDVERVLPDRHDRRARVRLRLARRLALQHCLKRNDLSRVIDCRRRLPDLNEPQLKE